RPTTACQSSTNTPPSISPATAPHSSRCRNSSPNCRNSSLKRKHMSVDSSSKEDVEYRIEHDTMGEVRVPITALWRAQTQRAVENFPISGRGLERPQIRALGLLKGACAQVNKDLGLLAPEKADAIIAAGAEDPRRPPRRSVPHRRLPNRFGNQLQHEHQ